MAVFEIFGKAGSAKSVRELGAANLWKDIFGSLLKKTSTDYADCTD
jgi:hypothetical protein